MDTTQFVVYVKNVINDSLVIDTSLAPFFVEVISDEDTAWPDVEAEAAAQAIEQANARYGVTGWFGLNVVDCLDSTANTGAYNTNRKRA